MENTEGGIQSRVHKKKYKKEKKSLNKALTPTRCQRLNTTPTQAASMRECARQTVKKPPTSRNNNLNTLVISIQSRIL
jgi:hypothetical protein